MAAALPSPRFEEALGFLDAGDVRSLTEILAAHPELVHERVEDPTVPYDGYFFGARLLHHVAGNPSRGELPEDPAAVARCLLAAGAEVDAPCGGGPAQSESTGTVLGLVASSSLAAEHARGTELLDVLLDAGADLEFRDGMALFGAVYHVVECRAQRRMAEHLWKRGARLDLAHAAALGALDRMAACFDDRGELQPAARPRFRVASDRMESSGRQDLLDEALVYASMNGRNAAVDFLLDRGANLQGSARVTGARITPLHGAAWAGWPELTARLLELGADPNVRDDVHDSSPPGWAAHCHREEALVVLLGASERFDLVNAVEFSRTERILELLVPLDPDAPVRSGSRGNFLRTAAFLGQVEVVRALLAKGADPGLTDAEGRTALEIARARGHDAIVTLLDG